MSAAENCARGDSAVTAEKEAEAAVTEFLERRAQILGRLSPEALRCVAAIFERRMEEDYARRKNPH